MRARIAHYCGAVRVCSVYMHVCPPAACADCCKYETRRRSDGEGALNNDTARGILKHKGTELRIRARGQHATTIEARNGILRHTMHLMEEDLKRNDISLNIKRLLAESIFVCKAFTYYNGESPYHALLGRSRNAFLTWKPLTSLTNRRRSLAIKRNNALGKSPSKLSHSQRQ